MIMEDDQAIGGQLIISGNIFVAGPPFSSLYSLSILPSLELILSSFFALFVDNTNQTLCKFNALNATFKGCSKIDVLMFSLGRNNVQLGPYGCLAWAVIFGNRLLCKGPFYFDSWFTALILYFQFVATLNC